MKEKEALLEVRSLCVRYPGNEKEILHQVDMTVLPGTITCVIGESGSGKSTLLQAILQLPGKVEITQGEITFCGQNLQTMSETKQRAVRGSSMGVVFQEPGASLNPIRRIGRQFYDALHAHDRTVTRTEARKMAFEILQSMQFEDPDRILNCCPLQLSGGMNQRVAIALAMVLKPSLLLADEPTSALDVTVQLQITEELLQIRKQYGTSVLLITHSMGVAAKLADQIAVMRDGQIVEYGSKEQVLYHPLHSYTKELLRAVPKLEDSAGKNFSKENRQPILEVKHVEKTFREPGGRRFKALDDLSLTVFEGECTGIVGESGCGKSTLAHIITGLAAPNHGSVWFCGTELSAGKQRELRRTYRDMKMIFQEPRSSFDPRLTIGKSIRDALKPVMPNKKEQRLETERLLETVGLKGSYADMYPWQVSAGECQRAAIARAIAQNPRFLICDEATSALDVSVQAQIMELLIRIRKEKNLSILFISHDLALVSSFCDRIYVLNHGKVVESGETAQIIHAPQQLYTKKLIASLLTV